METISTNQNSRWLLKRPLQNKAKCWSQSVSSKVSRKINKPQVQRYDEELAFSCQVKIVVFLCHGANSVEFDQQFVTEK